MKPILAVILHLAVLLLLPPLLLGVIVRVKAVFAGRRGAPLLQPYYDLAKLMRRGLTLSTTASWVFVAGPVVTLATVLLAGLLIPFGAAPAPVAFTGDLILFLYLFGLARFFTTASALDTGSAFGGMGAAREATFACLSEPALGFALLALARLAGSLKLGELLHAPAQSLTAAVAAPLVLVGIGLFIVLLAETCRIPVDDPTTHLELTMIHEAMVLDHGGPLFGIVLYASAVKLLVLGSVLVHVIAPFRVGPPWLDPWLHIAKLLALAGGIGVVESIMARLQMRHVPFLLVGAMLFCGFGFVLLIR